MALIPPPAPWFAASLLALTACASPVRYTVPASTPEQCPQPGTTVWLSKPRFNDPFAVRVAALEGDGCRAVALPAESTPTRPRMQRAVPAAPWVIVSDQSTFAPLALGALGGAAGFMVGASVGAMAYRATHPPQPSDIDTDPGPPTLTAAIVGVAVAGVTAWVLAAWANQPRPRVLTAPKTPAL